MRERKRGLLVLVLTVATLVRCKDIAPTSAPYRPFVFTRDGKSLGNQEIKLFPIRGTARRPLPGDLLAISMEPGGARPGWVGPSSW